MIKNGLEELKKLSLEHLCMNCMELTYDYTKEVNKCSNCFYEEKSPTVDLLDHGTIICDQRYIIGCSLSSKGGFSNTYISYDIFSKKKVVIKELYPSDLVSRNRHNQHIEEKDEKEFANLKTKFSDEFKKTKALIHNNIVKIFTFFEDNNTAYIVLEYYENSKDLEVFIKENNLNIDFFIKIIIDILSALECVHQNNIIHRDIKPANILIVKDFNEIKPILIDFGISKNKKSSTTTMKYQSVFFAPPEQSSDSPSDFQLDVYSCGSTLYHLITKKYTYDEEKKQHKETKDIEKELQEQKIDSNLIKIICKSLDYDLNFRYKTVKDFREDLVNYQKPMRTLMIGSKIEPDKMLTKRSPKRVVEKKSRLLGFIIYFFSVVILTSSSLLVFNNYPEFTLKARQIFLKIFEPKNTFEPQTLPSPIIIYTPVYIIDPTPTPTPSPEKTLIPLDIPEVTPTPLITPVPSEVTPSPLITVEPTYIPEETPIPEESIEPLYLL